MNISNITTITSSMYFAPCSARAQARTHIEMGVQKSRNTRNVRTGKAISVTGLQVFDSAEIQAARALLDETRGTFSWPRLIEEARRRGVSEKAIHATIKSREGWTR